MRLLAALAMALAVAAVPAVAAKPANQPGAPAPAAKAPAGPPRLAAKAWILVDPRDGAVLASKAPGKPLPIASATKLMTAYLALKKLKPGQTLTAPAYQALPAESLLDLRAGERLTVRDLLYGLILASANDGAVTLAEGVSGSVPRFVERMNRQADALGLDDTSYANPIGLDDPKNYSSAADLAGLASLLLENPLFARIADSATATLRSGDSARAITSRNTLLGRDPSVDGVKTGHTIGAGYVLVGSATRAGTRLVSVVLGARSEAARDAETLQLLDYGFSLYTPSRPVKQGEQLADPKLDYRGDRLPLVARRGIEVSARGGQPVETRVDAPEELSGPIERGEVLGRVVVTVDGRRAGATPLVAGRAAEAASLAQKVVANAREPRILIPVGAFVILLGLLLVARRRHPFEAGGNGRAGGRGSNPAPAPSGRRKRDQARRERTPEERRTMHEERKRRRQQRAESRGGEER